MLDALRRPTLTGKTSGELMTVSRFFALLSFCVVACSFGQDKGAPTKAGGDKTSGEKTNQSKTVPPSPTKSPTPQVTKQVADKTTIEKPAIIVNGDSINRNEYVRRMEYLPGLGRPNGQGGLSEVTPALATIDSIITEQLILQLAKEKSVIPTDKEIDFELAYRSRLNPQLMDLWLSSGRTMAEYRATLKAEIALFKLQTFGVTVTDQQIIDLYNLSKDTQYTTPAKVRLRVITVAKKADSDLVDKELGAGKSFVAIAALYSTDSSSKNGGLFGDIQIEALSEDIRSAVAVLKKGERTAWLKSGDLFAKFQADELIPKVVRPLDDDIKEELKRQFLLRGGSEKNNVSKWLRDARLKAKIEIANPDFQRAYLEFIERERKSNG
jgi:parvulin-like peptidyl-prolyl isomerase